MEDIAVRLRKKAMIDRIKLILGATIMTVVFLVSLYVLTGAAKNPMTVAVILTPIIVSFIAGSLIFILRTVKKMEADSFDEGVQLVIESIPVVCAMFNKDGTLIYSNDEAPKLYGFSDRQEYYQKYTLNLPEFQPDGRRTAEKEAEHIKKTIKEGKTNFEWMYKNVRGEPVPADVTLVRVDFQGEPHILEFTRDLQKVYENQRKENALKEKQQAILDFVPMICALFDEQYNTIDVNKEVENMFETTKQTYIDHFDRFIPPFQPDGTDSMEKSCQLIKTAFEKGSHRYEYVYQNSRAEPVPVEETATRVMIDGKPVVICFTRDLREFYKNREKDILIQKSIQTMSEQLNGHVTEQASAVTQSSAAIEEMIANIQSVTSSLHKNTENVKDLQEASEVGHTGLSGIAADIQEITRESESLLEINSVMANIASQTNLLSMNAAIEAAHAGESGRGFAVVADEIRKLAESSSKQSKTISVVLKKIKSSIDTITKSTDDVLKKFDAIDDGVRTVAAQDKTILHAMEEQGQGSKQILQAMGRLNELTQGVKEETRQMVENSRKAMQGKV